MQFNVIAHVKTCYGEKFGTPRQPGLVDEAWGELVFDPDFRNADCVRGLEKFSHLWLVFLFHQAIRDDWNPTVRPPRLGGNEKTGVFASRSPFRPNPIGLSCVRLERIELNGRNAPILHLGGVDLVNDTPILDIKPYIPYADSITDAVGGFAHDAPGKMNVYWEHGLDCHLDSPTKLLIENTLAIDPRPAYQQGQESRTYGCLISGLNVQWRVNQDEIFITSCQTA